MVSVPDATAYHAMVIVLVALAIVVAVAGIVWLVARIARGRSAR